jgi:DNA-binding transcriptional ArsR family regulator
MSSSNGAAGSADVPEDKRYESMAATMADPLRSKVFLAAAEPVFFVAKGTAPAESAGLSVRQISERVQESRRRVRYHLEVLCSQGLVEIVEEKRRSGVVENFYRSCFDPFLSKDQIEDVPAKRQQKIILGLLKAIFADAVAALEGGTYVRRPEWAAGRIQQDVDEQGWAELGAIFEQNTREAMEIMRRAQARLRESGEEPIRVGAATLLFEMAPQEERS